MSDEIDSETITKPSTEWLLDPRLGEVGEIKDPDGWRRNDGVTMETPITWDDFLQRFAASTIHVRPLTQDDLTLS